MNPIILKLILTKKQGTRFYLTCPDWSKLKEENKKDNIDKKAEIIAPVYLEVE